MLFDSVQRILDKFRLIANDRDLKIFWKSRNDLVHPLLYVAYKSDRVRARLLTDADSNRSTAIEREGIRRVCTALFNAPYIFELDRKAIFGRDDDVVKILDL